METPREYASIDRHFGQDQSTVGMVGLRKDSMQHQVWNSSNKQKFTIEGGQIDPRLRGKAIDVKVADININGRQTKVAVTCFENPHEGIEAQRPGNFPACRKPIVNHVFILRTDYDAADIIEAIQDMIAEEEAKEEKTK